MSSSNIRMIRKKYAQGVKDEIFTINTEVDEAISKIRDFDYNALKYMNIEDLKGLRQSIHQLKGMINTVNVRFDHIAADRLCAGDVGIDETEGVKGKVLIVSNEKDIRELLAIPSEFSQQQDEK